MGRASLMDRAWPKSRGEALHTQTFLGHPLGCAAALASIEILERDGLAERAAATGDLAREHLTAKLSGSEGVVDVRGLGLMLGVELRSPEAAATVVRESLAQGVILLPSGDAGRVLSITPPLTIEPDVLQAALDVVIAAVQGATQ